MGGHYSTQTVKESSDVLTSAVFDQAQNCTTVSQGRNVIHIGQGKDLGPITQNVTIQVDSACVSRTLAQGDFQQEVSNSIAQKMRQKEIALLEWMSAGGADQTSDIQNNVTTNIQSQTVQSCMATLNGSNVIDAGSLTGGGPISQAIDLSGVQKCFQGTKQGYTSSADLSNTVNQYSQYEAQNPLAFISDAFVSVFQSIIATAAIAFIVIVALVLLYHALKDHEHAAAPTAERPLPTGSDGRPNTIRP